MITNKGKTILSKYLVGQTPSYASHIAVGCGGGSSSTPGPDTDYSEKTSLSFEVARVPITSRGFQLVDGVENIVFTAELPSIEQYDISEIGVYPASRDPLSTGAGSRTILSFSQDEPWEIHDAYSSYAVPYYSDSLDAFTFSINSILVQGNKLEVVVNMPSDFPTTKSFKINSSVRISGVSPESYNLRGIIHSAAGNTIVVTPYGTIPTDPVLDSMNATIYVEFDDGIFVYQPQNPAFFVNNNNPYFSPTGIRRPEKPRVGVSSLMIRGDSLLDDFSSSASPPYHIHLNNFSINLSKNLPTDELRLAFSLTDTTNPEFAQFISSASFSIEFGTAESGTSSEREYARISGSPESLSLGHYVVSIRLEDMEKTSNFSWDLVNTVRIAASIEGMQEVGDTSSGLVTPGYIVFDSLRLENTSSTNPLYGLVGYSIISDPSGNPISKNANSTSLAEFRFAIELSQSGGMT